MSSLDFHLPGASHHNNYLVPQHFLPGQLGNITNHLLVAHGDPTSYASCTSPCPLDNPETYSYCHMPLSENPTAAFGQFNSVGTDFQMDQRFVECGAEIHDAESFLAHFNSQHRHYFTAGMPNLSRTATDVQHHQHHQHVLASTEVMSPPATPLDTSDSGTSPGTPSPLTPLSNSVEMTDVKPESSLHLRSISVASSAAGYSLELGADEEHRCRWREEGSHGICGQLFTDAEELFKHASEVHIKHAQKGSQGFCCGWDDCPRSEPGATGFPQRSKIERHMQTHIGRKPTTVPCYLLTRYIANTGPQTSLISVQHVTKASQRSKPSHSTCSSTATRSPWSAGSATRRSATRVLSVSSAFASLLKRPSPT